VKQLCYSCSLPLALKAGCAIIDAIALHHLQVDKKVGRAAVASISCKFSHCSLAKGRHELEQSCRLFLTSAEWVNVLGKPTGNNTAVEHLLGIRACERLFVGGSVKFGALQGLTVDNIPTSAHDATFAGNLPPMPVECEPHDLYTLMVRDSARRVRVSADTGTKGPTSLDWTACRLDCTLDCPQQWLLATSCTHAPSECFPEK
jgi:hypothetical protein